MTDCFYNKLYKLLKQKKNSSTLRDIIFLRNGIILLYFSFFMITSSRNHGKSTHDLAHAGNWTPVVEFASHNDRY